MPISWDAEAQWADNMVEKTIELRCSAKEAQEVVRILMQFSGAPARVTKLATYYLQHMTELSEELARDKKAREKN